MRKKMGEETRASLQVPFLLLIAFISFNQLQSSHADDTVLHESFDGKWVVSEKDEYQGVWKYAKSEGHEDFGLLVSEKARKYAIVRELDEPLNLKDETAVLQFETRFQNGFECGGAYLKYLRPQEARWIAKQFDNDSPYSIMFGPDKCGLTNKVHFILKHKNPKTAEYVDDMFGRKMYVWRKLTGPIFNFFLPFVMKF